MFYWDGKSSRHILFYWILNDTVYSYGDQRYELNNFQQSERFLF